MNESDKIFNKLLDNHGQKALGLAIKMLGTYDEANDAVQDALLKAYENKSKFRSESSFKTWFTSILLNICKNKLKKKKLLNLIFKQSYDNGKNYILSAIDNNNKNPELSYSDKQFTEDLLKKLDCLSINQKSVFILRFFEDMTVPEIAQVLKQKQGTVKIHLHRALQKIKNKFKGTE